MELKPKIEFINHKSKHLNDVISLGDANSKTLGHLPKVVYQEYARKKCIIVAKDKNQIIGHCLFRKVKKLNVIKIAQLCIDKNHRGKGIADVIINFLKETFRKDFRGIGLNCRNDYKHANELWTRNNFTPVYEKKGRAKKISILTYWYYNFNKPDLFSNIETDRVKALIDINIIIKLRDIKESDNLAIKALFSDDIISEIEYCYASETLFEIQRDLDRDRRKKTRELLKRFEVTIIEKDLLEGIASSLKDFFNNECNNDRSDRNQVSEAILAGIEYFITTDEELIKKRENISKLHPVEILSPIEFLLQIDNIINEEKYIGNRLAGTQVIMRNAKREDISQVVQNFIKIDKQEKKVNFKELVSGSCISTDAQFKVILKNGIIIGTWAYQCKDNIFRIDFLRIKDKQLEPYLFKQLITEAIHISISNKIKRIEFCEKYINDVELTILELFGFIEINDTWSKMLIHDICNSAELFEKYPTCLSFLKNSNYDVGITEDQKCKLERIFYPLKLTDLNIPTFIIPIRPFWASQLFDYYLASKSLFGGEPKLLWNRENVYYRSVNPNVEKAPARILWYISSSKSENRSKGIAAVSYLDEVHINTPKELFRRFKKYGVYEWRNVYDLAKEDIERDIKVIEFSDTEVFRKLLKFENISDTLGRTVTLQSPLKIDNSEFIQIYSKIRQ